MESQQLQTLCPRVRYNVYLNILPGNENINGIAHDFKHCVLEFDFYNIYLNILPGIKKKRKLITCKFVRYSRSLHYFFF